MSTATTGSSTMSFSSPPTIQRKCFPGWYQQGAASTVAAVVYLWCAHRLTMDAIRIDENCEVVSRINRIILGTIGFYMFLYAIRILVLAKNIFRDRKVMEPTEFDPDTPLGFIYILFGVILTVEFLVGVISALCLSASSTSSCANSISYFWFLCKLSLVMVAHLFIVTWRYEILSATRFFVKSAVEIPGTIVPTLFTFPVQQAIDKVKDVMQAEMDKKMKTVMRELMEEIKKNNEQEDDTVVLSKDV